jgi:hypothetical protein
MEGNETNLLTFTQGVNTVLLDGYLGAMLLVGVAFVLFTSFYFVSRDFQSSATATGFICFTLSLVLVAMQLLNQIALWITLVATIIGVVTTWAK